MMERLEQIQSTISHGTLDDAKDGSDNKITVDDQRFLGAAISSQVDALEEKFDTKKSTTSSSEYLREVFSNQYLSLLLLNEDTLARVFAPYRKKSYFGFVK